MKWLSEEEENYLRNKLPVLIKSSLSESFSETASSVLGEIGNRVLAKLHQINVGVAQRNVEDARRLQSDVLMHHYATHLGLKTAHLHSIINDYQKEQPIAPSPVLFVPGKRGRMQTMPNPNYGLEKREYDNKNLEYNERQRVLRQIKGLQQSNPTLGALARQFSRQEEGGRRAIQIADPIVSRPGLGFDSRYKLPSGVAGPQGAPRQTRDTRISDIYLQRADALRRRRKIRSKLP